MSAQTKGDPAATLLPLVHQEPGADGKPKTTILEQPLDFTTLADKYNDYVTVSSRTTHSHSALNFSQILSNILRVVPGLSSVDVGRVAVHVQGFINAHHGSPFFLYMPFSHVHTTAGNMPQKQCKPRLFFLSVGNPVSRMVFVCWLGRRELPAPERHAAGALRRRAAGG